MTADTRPDPDHDNDVPAPSTDADEPIETPASEAETTDADEHSDERPAVEAETPGDPLGPRETFGELRLHYPDRDVRLVVSESAALQVLRMHSWRQQARLSDSLIGEVPMKLNCWIVYEPEGLLAVTWTPEVGLPRPEPRPVVDPVVAG